MQHESTWLREIKMAGRQAGGIVSRCGALSFNLQQPAGFPARQRVASKERTTEAPSIYI